MTRRFYTEQSLTDPTAELAGDEAHHAIRVMRVKVGDRVILFDGSGTEAEARVRRVDRHVVALEVCRRVAVDRELPQRLTLGVALPKGDRQRWLVEKLVELGTGRLIPLLTERTVVEPTENSLKRLRRTVIEASKQCGRNQLMTIGETQPLAEFITRGAAEQSGLLAHPTGVLLHSARLPAAKPEIYCAVGPEGGFTKPETCQCQESGGQVIALGNRVLRTETAAVAIAAFFSLHRDTGS